MRALERSSHDLVPVDRLIDQSIYPLVDGDLRTVQLILHLPYTYTGRESANDVDIPNGGVSEPHAELTCAEGGVVLLKVRACAGCLPWLVRWVYGRSDRIDRLGWAGLAC